MFCKNHPEEELKQEIFGYEDECFTVMTCKRCEANTRRRKAYKIGMFAKHRKDGMTTLKRGRKYINVPQEFEMDKGIVLRIGGVTPLPNDVFEVSALT